MKPTAEDLINSGISSVGVYLYNKVKNHIFEKEPIEKTAARKADFEKIIEEKIELEEFPAISQEDIKAVCEIIYNSNDINLIIKQLYVFRCGVNKSLDEIKEEFVSLFPKAIKLENGRNLEAEERSSFLLKVFEVLDEGIQIALNRAANEGSSGASNALSNRRHFDMKDELANGFKDVKKLINENSRGMEEKENPVEKLPSLFISYAREDDEPFVEKLYQDLKNEGFEIWWDRAAMKNRGRTFFQEIRDAIEDSDLLIAVIGPKAMESDSVRYEWEHALLFSKGVIPILRIGDHKLLPPEMSKLHCPDFREESSYEKVFQELIRLLREPIPPLCPIIGVPSLPPNYLPRKDDLNIIKEIILADTVKPVVITSAKQITALQGMGGMGKSVLSTAFARSVETRRAFYDGIFWVTVGLDSSDSDLIEYMRQIGTKFGDDPANYSSKREAEASLSNVLSDKVCLIILDDIWKVSQATPFFNALGSRCRLLITTRNDDVVTSLGAKEHKIEVLGKSEALKLLANWCEQEIDSLPSEAAEVARECGYLPLALSICGAMAKSGISWTYILEALQEADLEFIEAQLPNYPNPNVGRALKVSVDFLSREDPDAVLRYQELAIFPEDELVPEDTIAILWKHTGNLKRRNVEKLLTKLKDRSLLRLDGKAPNRLISLHDLQFDYLKATAGDFPSLHNNLLEAYSKECGNKWSSGPEDGYFYRRLAYHMKEAGKREDLHNLLLDFEWMCSKLKKECVIQIETGIKKPDVNSLLHDYDYLYNDTEIELVQGAIRLSYNAIVKDKTQLAGQLLGRLLCFNEKGIQSLLNHACKFKDGVRLLPRTSSLRPPGGPLIRTLGEHNYWVNAVAVTPNGKYAVSASEDGTVKMWDLEKGVEKRTFKGHDHIVTAVSVTPDGKCVISASGDGTLKVWDLENAKEKTTLKGHDHIVKAVATTPDGKYVISGSSDKTLKIWDLEKAEEKVTLRGHNDVVADIAVTPNGKNVVSASWDNTLKVWDLENGMEKTTFKGHHSAVNAVAVTPNGKYVISGSSDSTLKVWNLEDGEEKTTFKGHHISMSAVAVTPDGKYVVSGLIDGMLKVLDLEKEEEIATLRRGHEDTISTIAVTPNGKYAISGSWDNTLKVWDLKKAKEKTILEDHDKRVKALAVTSNGKYLISGSIDGTLKIWDLEKGVEKRTFKGHDHIVTAVSVTPDGKCVISASGDGTLKVWDLENAKEKITLKGHEGWVNKITVTPDGKNVVSASWDNTLKVWDLENGMEKTTFKGHHSAVNAVAVTPNGKYVISGSYDNTLKLWCLENGEEKAKFEWHDWMATSIAVTPNGKYAILGSIDGTLKVWNLEKAEEKTRLKGHEGWVNKITVTPDGKYAISASSDKTLKVWELETGDMVSEFTGDSSFETCVSPEGEFIVASDSLGKIHFLRLQKSDYSCLNKQHINPYCSPVPSQGKKFE